MDLLNQIISIILSLLNKTPVQVQIPLGEPKESPKVEDKSVEEVPGVAPEIHKEGIDWTNPKSQITAHFTVGEIITLHSWNRLATEEDGLTDQVKTNLITLCQKMENVHDILGCSINVHCGFRSVKYNQEVLHSLPNDVHALGMAIDLDANPHLTIQEIKDKLGPLLVQLELRMEKGTTSWVHLDFHAVGPSGRYFTA